MTLSTLIQQLDTLGFGGFKAALQRQSEDTNYIQLPFEERLYQLLEAEQSERRDKKIKRLLSQAKLKERQAHLIQWSILPKEDWSVPRSSRWLQESISPKDRTSL